VNPSRHAPQNKSIWIGSWDVQDMYNQIDQTESIEFIEQLATDQGWITKNNNKVWRFIFELIQWVYDTAYVTHKGQYYKQKRGLPMGSPLSPPVANLYMAALETKATATFISCGYKAYSSDVIYRRYLDDILVICRSDSVRIDDSNGCSILDEDALALITFILQSAVRSNINLDLTGEAWRDGESIEYLDLRLRILNRNSKKWVKTEVFDKPTNLHIYTDPSTWYPMHYVYNWIQGENIRFIRNSSDPQSYNDTLTNFKMFLFKRNFCEIKIARQLQLNDWDDRAALLRGEKPHQKRKQDKGKGKIRQVTYIPVDNSGCRDIITSSVKMVDNISGMFEPQLGLSFLPVVKKGKSILSVMTSARKFKSG
jgi:hypothetical protein